MASLKKNLLYNMSYQVLMIILPLITAPYISRVLGVDGIGTYSYVYSIAYYFGLCGMLGVSNHGNRSIALVKKDKEKLSQTFSNIYCIQLLTTLLAMFCYIVYTVQFCSLDNTIARIAGLFVLSYVIDINWFFFGMEQFKMTVTRNACIKVLTVIGVFSFVKKAEDLWLYVLIMSLGMVLGQVYLWLQIRKYIYFVPPKLKEMRTHIKPMLILFIPVIAYSIYKVMDKIMLGALASITEVGYYENADKIINIPVGFITAFGTVMMPRIASMIADKSNQAVNIYTQKSFKYFSMIAIGMAFGLIGVGDTLAPVYFGEAFTASAPIIEGLSITLIFMTWANIIRTQYLIPMKQDKPYVLSTIVGAVLNFCLNITLVPIWGAKGALVGTVVAEFSVFFVQAICVRKELDILQYLRPSMIYLGNGIVMAAVVRWIGGRIGTNIVSLMVQVAVGAVLYLVLCVIEMVVCADSDLQLLWKKVARRKA